MYSDCGHMPLGTYTRKKIVFRTYFHLFPNQGNHRNYNLDADYFSVGPQINKALKRLEVIKKRKIAPLNAEFL